MFERVRAAIRGARKRSAARQAAELEDFSNAHRARREMRRQADDLMYHQDLTSVGSKGLQRFGR